VTSNNWLALAILALVGTAAYIIIRQPPITLDDLDDTDW
jgi:LPXTG-motif cell wall-anchored protein